jgi:hypothetical protein
MQNAMTHLLLLVTGIILPFQVEEDLVIAAILTKSSNIEQISRLYKIPKKCWPRE